MSTEYYVECPVFTDCLHLSLSEQQICATFKPNKYHDQVLNVSLEEAISKFPQLLEFDPKEEPIKQIVSSRAV